MLKYEQPEEHATPCQQTEQTPKVSPHVKATECLMSTLDSQERAQAYLDRQQGYADKLMATVQTEARKFRRSRAVTRNIAIAIGLSMVVFVLIFVAQGIMHGKWDWDVLTSMTSMTGVLGMATVSSKTYKSAASELSTIEDLRAVGPLAESLDIEEKTVRGQVEKALIRLLPRLQASDAGLLNPQQRMCLNKALQGKNEELMIAILRAYEQVGDETALPYVEALARKAPNNSPSAQITGPIETSLNVVLGSKISAILPASVAEAALACLPSLRNRVELQRASQTLLRGASATDVAPDTLLRAAYASEVTPPEQLLRPAGEV